MELYDSYDNWIERFDLQCATNEEIGLIASAFFVGWAFTLAWLPRVSDKIGRQKFVIAGTTLNFLAFLTLLATKNYKLLVFCMFVLGMTSTIRLIVGVNYLCECVMREDFKIMFAVMTLGDGIGGISISFYFMEVAKDHIWPIMVLVITSGIAMIGSWFYTESPRYLVKSG